MDRAREAARHLADRHRDSAVEADPVLSLLNYAESPRTDDWTLRSALVRLAQPEPQLVADVLVRVRRLDAVLHHVARALERHTVVCDRAVTVESVAGPPLDPYPDTRTADVARLAASAGDDHDVVIETYLGDVDLDADERAALPLLGVAVEFDTLADELVAWARIAPGADPPSGRVGAVIEATQRQLDELGVPVEEFNRRGRRGGAAGTF